MDEKCEESSSQDERSGPSESQSAKKRKKFGTVREVLKKLRASTFETGPDCECKTHQFFRKIPPQQRSILIKKFNELGDWNKQSAHLAGLINIVSIKRRYAKGDEEEANFRDCSFHYKIRMEQNDGYQEEVVCRQGFISLHGITKARVLTIQSSLKKTGSAPEDQRGKHKNRPQRLDDENKKTIFSHISSFKGRTSHYSLNKSSKIYLPEELNVRKLYDMFCEMYPGIETSYEKYRQIFNAEFNIAFGYQRSDTCSTCDKNTAEVEALNKKLVAGCLAQEERNEISSKFKSLKTLQELHLRRAGTFYSRKRAARKESQKDVLKEALCMDYQRNLLVPNITTNDVYYKRQLSYYTFNIHVLSTGKSVWFGYSEEVAKKVSNEVVSFLHYYITNFLDPRVKHLTLFCDSCEGQNKNYTVFRYLPYMVHVLKRLETVCITFPWRGHSFLECDKNMGLLNTKKRVEVPREWAEAISEAREKPEPFVMVQVDQSIVRDWKAFFGEPTVCRYVNKCPFPTRPIKVAKISKEHPRFIQHREMYNAAWVSSVLTTPKKRSLQSPTPQEENTFLFSNRAYEETLQISGEKFRDLQHLKTFCGDEAKAYFDNLKYKKENK